MARDFAKAFYKSKAWLAVRNYALKRDSYICKCYKITGKAECSLPANEVHHIIWLTPKNIHDPNIALNADNLIAINRDCHFNVHKQQRRDATKKEACTSGFEFDKNGFIIQISERQ
jgi:5-methylcytosine-specific restriction endonuclease McrA